MHRSTEGHRVAIVRVQVRGLKPHELLIEILEVGHDPDGDRLLSATTSTREACRVLAAWLDEPGTLGMDREVTIP